MYKEIETYIKANCPQIFQLFSNALESEEYMSADLVKVVDNLGLEREKAMKGAGINPAGYFELNDYYNQFLGFFFGFQLACKIREEVK